MKKISEMTFAELAPYLVAVAAPAGRLFSDEAVCTALDDMRKQIKAGMTFKEGLGLFTKMCVPVLMNETHKKDVAAIIAAANNTSEEEALNMNATAAIVNLFALLVTDNSLEYLYRVSE